MGYGLWWQNPCKPTWEMEKCMGFEGVWVIPVGLVIVRSPRAVSEIAKVLYRCKLSYCRTYSRYLSSVIADNYCLPRHTWSASYLCGIRLSNNTRYLLWGSQLYLHYDQGINKYIFHFHLTVKWTNTIKTWLAHYYVKQKVTKIEDVVLELELGTRIC